MAEDSRLVRDLLDANLALTSQFIELAKLAIGAPQIVTVERAPMQDGEPVPAEFTLSSADDWEDIPEKAMAEAMANVFEFPPRTDPRALDPALPLHMSEEEEDLRFSVGAGHTEPLALTRMLEAMKAPNPEIEIEPLA